MHSILLALHNESPDIAASAIISIDGLVITSILPPEYDEDSLGAVSAGTLLLGEQAARFFANGELNRAFIDYAKHKVVIERSGEEILLMVVLNAAAKISALTPIIQQTREKIIAQGALF